MNCIFWVFAISFYLFLVLFLSVTYSSFINFTKISTNSSVDGVMQCFRFSIFPYFYLFSGNFQIKKISAKIKAVSQTQIPESHEINRKFDRKVFYILNCNYLSYRNMSRNL